MDWVIGYWLLRCDSLRLCLQYFYDTMITQLTDLMTLSTKETLFAGTPDMRKGVDTQTLSAEILTDCGNCLLATLNNFFICFLMLKYYGTFTYIIQYDHLNAHLNPIKVTNDA